MYVAQLRIIGAGTADPNDISHKVNALLGALRMNRQICGREWPITVHGHDVVTTVFIPERDALNRAHANRYVQEVISSLSDISTQEFVATILGEDIEGASACTCADSRSFILYTTYLSLEPPLRCGDCFNPVPLYTVPPTYNGEYYDIIGWQSDYQACDTLQMHCRTLERATIREMSRLDSNLSAHGIEICTKIRGATGTPVYYYLYRYRARSRKQENERRCPSCGAGWRLEEPWHMFDFKCDRCQLVSTIAWDVG